MIFALCELYKDNLLKLDVNPRKIHNGSSGLNIQYYKTLELGCMEIFDNYDEKYLFC